MRGKRQPGQGNKKERQTEEESQRQNDDAAPSRQDSEPAGETAAQILQKEERAPRSRAAARVGLTAAVIAGVAVAAGIAGLSLLANLGDGNDGPGPNARPDAGRATAISGPPLRMVSVSPTARSRGVSGDTGVRIAFSAKLAPTLARPILHPAVAGRWRTSGRILRFTPSAAFAPLTRYTLMIPAGKSGLRSAGGGAIVRPALVRFRTEGYSQRRLAELLSQLGYLPLSWQPNANDQTPAAPHSGSIAGQEQIAFSPPVGSFTWSSGYPADLRAQWLPDRPNVVVRGAVMAFQAQHRLAVNGNLSTKFWHALFAAAARSERNTLGYSYAVVSEGSPETITIWHNGHQVMRSLANTGVPVAPTVFGTFPVYRRFRYQIMSGTNPDGSHYADPVTFVSYFNGGDAVHYFPRDSYGSPQSLGCVELPYDQAQRAWPFLTYGSLVTVSG